MYGVWMDSPGRPHLLHVRVARRVSLRAAARRARVLNRLYREKTPQRHFYVAHLDGTPIFKEEQR
jgi:hypothetical protein